VLPSRQHTNADTWDGSQRLCWSCQPAGFAVPSPQHFQTLALNPNSSRTLRVQTPVPVFSASGCSFDSPIASYLGPCEPVFRRPAATPVSLRPFFPCTSLLWSYKARSSPQCIWWNPATPGILIGFLRAFRWSMLHTAEAHRPFHWTCQPASIWFQPRFWSPISWILRRCIHTVRAVSLSVLGA